MKILVDTNVLLRLRDLSSPQHARCLVALERSQGAGDDLHVCAQVLIEYWVVATRPRDVNGFGLDAVEAEKDLRDLEQAFLCLPEPYDMASRWRDVVSRYGVLGRQAHDARLVALMSAHGIRHLMTLNAQDFSRYQGIVCLEPESD